MNSNEQPYGRWSQTQRNSPSPHLPARPFVSEDTLKSGQVQIERKMFTFALKENVRGRLLRITEGVGDRHNSIIIPATGLAEFKRLPDEMVAASNELPPEKTSGQ